METAFLVTLVVSLSLMGSLLTWNYCRIRQNNLWWEMQEELKNHRKAFLGALVPLIRARHELTKRQDGLSDKIDELQERLDCQHEMIGQVKNIIKDTIDVSKIQGDMLTGLNNRIATNRGFIAALQERVSDIEAGLEDEVADAILTSILGQNGQKEEKGGDENQEAVDYIHTIVASMNHLAEFETLKGFEEAVGMYNRMNPEYELHPLWNTFIKAKRKVLSSYREPKEEAKKEEPKAEGI